MYDPLGFFDPVIVISKVIMQKIWLEKLDWGTRLNSTLLNERNRFYGQIPQLSKLTIPHYFLKSPECSSIEIHEFADAILTAYGPYIYFSAIYNYNTVSCFLVASKSRIAPVKTTTLARLELCIASLSVSSTKF